jgi:import inner membrane translocase subunit TIM44
LVYKKVSETFRNAASTAGSALHKVREAKLVDSVRTGYAFLKEEMSNTSPRRKPKPPPDAPLADAPPENPTVNAIVPVVKKTSGWEKRWETLKEKVRDPDPILTVQKTLNHVLIV